MKHSGSDVGLESHRHGEPRLSRKYSPKGGAVSTVFRSAQAPAAPGGGRRARARPWPRAPAPRAARCRGRDGRRWRSPPGSPRSFTVRWGRAMEAGGRMAQRTTSGAPFEMPPATPPAWFVTGRARPASRASSSLYAEPRMRAAAKPAPISKPRTAPTLSSACASSASSLSKTGSPSPAGTPSATTSTTPPTESPASFASSIARSISAGRGRVGRAHRVALDLREVDEGGPYARDLERVPLHGDARARRGSSARRPPRRPGPRSRGPRSVRRPASPGCRTWRGTSSPRARGGRRRGTARSRSCGAPRCGRAGRRGCRWSCPSNTPERISARSDSRLAVVTALCPGRRRSRSRCTSASDRASPGGTPSITTPTAGPWLSPKVEMTKNSPKQLPGTALSLSDR